MLHMPSWPTMARPAPATISRLGRHLLAGWLRHWHALCQRAERPTRRVPYY